MYNKSIYWEKRMTRMMMKPDNSEMLNRELQSKLIDIWRTMQNECKKMIQAVYSNMEHKR